MDPQIGQVAIPVAGSTSRRLAQPFVRQKGRPVELWAADARRRIRRIELARPAYVAAAERDIIGVLFFVLSGAPQAVWAWAAILLFTASRNPSFGADAVLVVRAAYRERPLSRRSTGAVAADR